MASDSRQLAKTLLEKAAGDEATLRAIAGSQGVPDEAIGLHAQQAVEKALKATLAVRGVHYPLTHDIDRLLELVETEGLELSESLRGGGAADPLGARSSLRERAYAGRRAAGHAGAGI